jgi:type I restriction enzyme, S subunit
MELKAGYKNTEIGFIPEEWEVISFDKAFYFLSTASYSRAEISKDADVKYVHYGDIHTKLEHFLDFKYCELPTIKNEQLKTYSLIKEGDLIMADASEDYEGIGKSVEVRNIGNNKAISGLHTFLLRGKEGVFSNEFKAYLHSNKIIKTQYDKLATGLKVYGVSKSNLKQIQIPLPPLPEQTAIATVLSDIDGLIQTLAKKIAKKQLIKKGAMQKLLTPKEGWEEKSLGEICTKIQDGNYGESYPKSDEFLNSGIPFLTSKAIGKDGKLKINLIDYISTAKHRELTKAHIQLNDILFTNRGASVGAIGYVDDRIAGGNIGPQLTLIRTNNDLALPIYLFQYLKTDIFRRQIIGKDSGSAMNFFGIGQTEKFIIPLPSLTEQSRIAQTLSDMDSDIETLEKKLVKYKLLKQGLIQNLLTGKIRLRT